MEEQGDKWLQDLDMTPRHHITLPLAMPAASLYRSKRKFSPSMLRTSETYFNQHDYDPIVIIPVYETVILEYAASLLLLGKFSLES